MSKKICGIYKITNTINNKVYIGQSIDVKWRWYSHKCELRHGRHGNSHLQNAWSLYGEDAFNFELLEECSKEDLNIREQYYIDLYDSYNNDKGYNLTLGGGGTVTANEVLQFDSYGNLVAEYRNGIEASEKTGLGCSAIYQCCNRKLKKVGMYYFVFKSEYDDCCDMGYWIDSNRNTPVEQYDLDGNLVKTWDSCAEIVRELGINPISCLLHKAKTYHGYVWRRINDNNDLTSDYFFDAKSSCMFLKKKKIYQYDLDGNLIRTYTSIHEAYRFGWNKNMIRECIRGTKDKYKGYIWTTKELGVA